MTGEQSLDHHGTDADLIQIPLDSVLFDQTTSFL
jgi:hypothetical protein